jgi:hypothetical protein
MKIFKWSRWVSGIVSWLAFLIAGCDQPLNPTKAAPVAASSAPRPIVLATSTGDVAALAGDDSGVYWISSSNELWGLASGSVTPHRLATDTAGVLGECQRPPTPAIGGGNIFWTGTQRVSALHRTKDDGAADDVFTSSLVGVSYLAADATNVYWTEVWGQDDQGTGVIRMLPLSAAPDTAPTLLVSLGMDDEVSSLAALDGALYWTPYGAVGATMYHATLWTAPVSVLAAGGTGTTAFANQPPYGLTTIGDAIALAYYQDLWTSTVAILPQSTGWPQAVAVLPEESFVSGLSAADGWIYVTAGPGPACGSIPSLQLYAIPEQGGALLQVATGLRTAAVSGPAGMTYVDQSGALVSLPYDGLRAFTQTR